MNLVIDIGNTRVKLATFDGKELAHTESHDNLDSVSWSSPHYQDVEHAIVASVRAEAPVIPSHISETVLVASPELKLPIDLDYETPETLGVDRLANAVGAWSLYPNTNVLSLDLGTCIKFDFVSADGVYQGGSIAPGLAMRCRALHEQTGRLPQITPQAGASLIGKSTFESLNSGVVVGMQAEILGTFRQYSDRFPDLHIIGTGGDLEFFADGLKSSIFADDFLTLRGLNTILRSNT